MHLEGLTQLEELNLKGTEVTDSGLKHLKGLTKLKRLELPFRIITDAGLEHLKHLINLQEDWTLTVAMLAMPGWRI